MGGIGAARGSEAKGGTIGGIGNGGEGGGGKGMGVQGSGGEGAGAEGSGSEGGVVERGRIAPTNSPQLPSQALAQKSPSSCDTRRRGPQGAAVGDAAIACLTM